jgi:hypothetical protein
MVSVVSAPSKFSCENENTRCLGKRLRKKPCYQELLAVPCRTKLYLKHLVNPERTEQEEVANAAKPVDNKYPYFQFDKSAVYSDQK